MSTNSSSYVDVDSLSLSTVWVSDCTALLMVTIGAVQIDSGSNARAYFQIIYQSINATSWTTVATSVHEWQSGGYGLRDIQMHALLTLAGGAYNFKVQIKTDTGHTIKLGYYSSNRTLTFIQLA